MPTPCKQCIHYREKQDNTLREQQFVECKPPVEAGLWLRAFYQFAANGMVTEPFSVKAVDGKVREAWPFQFHPENLSSCDGFVEQSDRVDAVA